LKAIVNDALLHFNYDNKEEDNVIDRLENSEDEIKDYVSSDVRSRDANCYKTEVKAIIQHNNIMLTLSDSNDDCYEENGNSETDEHSSMTEAVLKHCNYIKPTASKNTMCSTRAAMESIAYRSQKAQANQINKERLQDSTYKQVLDVGDIGIVYVQPKTWNSCVHPYLPVMVMGCKIPKH